MTFRVNDSPLAGTEGTKVTGRMIRDRLLREAEGNVALRVRESDDKDAMEVAGRGELQLGISDRDHAPRRLRTVGVAAESAAAQERQAARLEEPIEEVVIDVDEIHSGVVVQKMSERKARDDRTQAVRRRTRAHGVLMRRHAASSAIRANC